ncbi:enoyl-CoA hydratase/isomerase family protein [Mesobacillus maritimus]|uniref:enoyl-CoA hydratase/isomerase family protein n=1 Tax=Mesobacillus maritimus TaxID=1643336 RepID=UPI0020416374|nr:enoyl-CoA hydratase/isomerase family protein [Mesobacillus maritimus]MCM3670748.1 enoyl-CoA hydratase/isomerase family protein [Mesobacillus maritimus]
MRVTIKRTEKDGKITLQESGGFAIVTINRPDLKNALTNRMWKDLAAIGRRIPENPKNKVVILRGSKNHFTAGSDIKQFNNLSIDEANEAFRLMEEAIATFEKIPLPTIGAINGPAMGAGFELALACDIRVGSPNTLMGIPVGRLGITLNQMFAKRIADMIGKSRTLDLVYTGRLLKPDECYDLGLLNYLLETDEDINSFTIQIGKKIMEQSPASVLAVKRAVAFNNPTISIPWETGLGSSVDPVDFPEGVRSFVEKRKPNFQRRVF